MIGFIFIFLLSTIITQESDGKRTNRNLLAPTYHIRDNNYNIYSERGNNGEKSYSKTVYYQYGDRVDEDNDEEKDFKDETRYEEKYDDDEEYGSRRLFEWFSRLFKSTTPHTQTVETTTSSVYSRELRERIFLKALHSNLTHILAKLSEIEKHVSYAMEQKEAYAILTKGKPTLLTRNGFYFGDRRKREITATDAKTNRDTKVTTVEDDRKKRNTKIAVAKDSGKKVIKKAITEGDGRKKEVKTNASKDHIKRDTKIAAVSDKRYKDIQIATAVNRRKRDTKKAKAEGDRRKRESYKTTKESTKTVTEKLEVIEAIINTTECPCNVTSGRRLGSVPSPTQVKNKLLLYLQESFQEIKGKIMSLRNLKQAFSDNISFKIGYILANIDTLEVNMLNMKVNMDKNKELWQDSKILELYDTLKVSNQALSGLIDLLKSYLEKLSYPQVKPQLNLV